jgi:hypothetical protein
MDETIPAPKTPAAAEKAASDEWRAAQGTATTISKSLKGFGQRAGETNKGRQTS